jgi:two-component system, response regulator
MKNEEVEILLVEDNKQDAEMAMRALKKSNLVNNLIHLKDGAQAIDFLFGTGEFSGRNINNKPNLILLDLKMPKMDGIEVLRIIKQDPLTKKIPVIVLTSSKESPDIEACYALGVNSYIVKPVEFDSFIRGITELGFYWMVLNQSPA